MAKKIKFPLKMADGSQVRSIEELREHFDLTAVLSYYTSGRLTEWLTDRYYDVEAEKIKALEPSSKEFAKNLCEILAVPYSETGADDVDLADIAVKNERYEHLKQFTADDTILAAVDLVAFTQEDLADLLDKDAKLIYLCGERFSIPCSKGGVTYIGVNNPVVDVAKGYDEKEISFKGVQGKNILDDSIKSIFTSNPDFFGDLPNDAVKEAAENGNINAQLELAHRYSASENSPCGLSNPEQSEYWYSKVHTQWEKNARNGDFLVQYTLGQSYYLGQNGFEMDDDESNYWYRSSFAGYQRLAEQGDAEAQYSLGVLFECGQGTDQDMYKAVYWLEKSAKQGNLEAMQELIQIYGNEEYDVYDKNKSKSWERKYDTAEFIRCKKAAEQGDAFEQNILGDYYTEGKGIETDLEKADYWYKLALTGFKKAAEQGDARAQMKVAWCYYAGEGVQMDKHTAFVWYKKAAEQANNKAMKIVGDCYKTGDGVEQNETEYMLWYTKAAKQGNQDALFTLTTIAFKTSMDELTNTLADLKDSFNDNSEIETLREQAREINANLQKTSSTFRLIVDSVSGIPFAGIIVEGVIETGSVQTLDEVAITKNDGSLSKCYVVGIEMSRRNVNYAEEGDRVVLQLKGVKSKEISKGAVVTKN